MSNPRLLPCDQAAIRGAAPPASSAAGRSWVLAAAGLGSTLPCGCAAVGDVARRRSGGDLNAPLPAMQWVVNAYTLCMSALLLVGGAAADQFGRRRIFLIGVLLFALASLGCGFAPQVSVLIAGRALQGIGAALLVPCAL